MITSPSERGTSIAACPKVQGSKEGCTAQRHGTTSFSFFLRPGELGCCTVVTPLPGPSMQVKSGSIGAGRALLSRRMKWLISLKWLAVVFPVSLCPTYAMLRARVKFERWLFGKPL